jgi:hypothetical protein
MKCLNCKSNEVGTDDIEVMHQGVEIGRICTKCMFGVDGLRLFVRRQKNGTMVLKEMQVIPNPR